MADPVKIEITGNVKGLLDALERGTAGLKGFAKDTNQISTGLGNALNNIKAPFIALAGLLGGAAFLKSTVEETKNWTMEAQKLARVLGITTEQASVLNLAIGDIYGTSEEYLTAVAKITKTLNSNEDAFKQLGVATRDSNGHLRSTPAIMTDVNTKLAGMKSGTDRNIESTRIYGKGWVEVQRYLKLTSEVMEEAQVKAEKLNLIVGKDMVEATNAYRLSINDLEDTVRALKIRIGSELMPTLTTLNEDLAVNGPTAVQSLGTSLNWLYKVLLMARGGIGLFFEYMEHGFRQTILAFNTGSALMKAALSGHWGDIAAINAKYKKDDKAEELDHVRTMLNIHNETEKLLDIARGKGRKKTAKEKAEEEEAAKEKAEEEEAARKKAEEEEAARKRAAEKGGTTKPKENIFPEEKARLARELLKVQGDTSKEAQLQVDLAEIQLDYQDRLAKYAREVKEGRLKPDEAKKLAEEAAKLREQAERAILDRLAAIDKEKEEKDAEQFAKEQEADAEQNQKVAAARLERKRASAVAELDLEMAVVKRRAATEEITGDEGLRLLVALQDKKYAIEKKALTDRLQLANLETDERLRINTDLQALENQHLAAQQENEFKRQDLSNPDTKPKANVYQEELARLAQDFATAQGEASREASIRAEWDKIDLDYQDRLAKYAKAVKEGRLKPNEARQLIEDAARVRDQAQQSLIEKEQAAQAERSRVDAEKFAKEQEVDAEQDRQTADARMERKTAHALAELDLEKNVVERRYTLGEISALEELRQLMLLEDKRYEIERKSLTDRLALAELEPKERLRINTELQALEDRRAAQQQANEFKRQDLTPGAGGQGGLAGAMAGIKAFLGQGQSTFDTWKSAAFDACGAVVGAFAGAFRGILSGQMTFSQGLKMIWKSITETVIAALAQMALKFVMMKIGKAIMGDNAKAAQGEAVAEQQAAAAGIFNANSSIPIVGPVIAAGLVALMNATLIANAASAKGITAVANAQGSLITGPTLGLLGEAGVNEVVAPETVFKDWAGNLTTNILRQERQVGDYQRLGAGYASAAAQAGPGFPPIDMRGAIIAGESAESARLISDMVWKHLQARDKRVG